MKVVINPTWRCQLNCDYCWMRALEFRAERERSVRAWLWWLQTLPRPLTVDVSGGEPLMYPGILALLRGMREQGISWAMTSNLVHTPNYRTLVGDPIAGCVAFNVSAHAGGPDDLYERANMLRRAGYPVTLNVVDHPAARPVPAGIRASHITYQPWQEGTALDGVVRRCDAGRRHVVAAPDGKVYRCAVELQLGVAPLGTIGKPWKEIAPNEPHRCKTGCSTCYTDNPGAWQVRMEPVE